MNIACQQCNSSYNLPDNRIPQNRVVSFPCPSCKGKVTIDTRNQADAGADGSAERLVFKPLADTSESKLTSDDLKKKILHKIDDLPPMPKVLFKARAVMDDPKSSFKDVAKVIETDQAIAAKVLKVANSAYYGLSGMVNSIHQATVVLGQKTLEQVITMVSSSSLLGKRLKGYNLSAGILWRHSLAVALGSQMIAEKRAPSLENDAFSVGLIHDAGKLALDDYIARDKKIFTQCLQQPGSSLLDCEQQVLGFDHTQMAEELCHKWKLPEHHAIAMRFHHHPGETDNDALTHIVYLANCIANQIGFACGTNPEEVPIDPSILKALQLKDSDMEKLSEELVAAVQKITDSLSG